MFPSSTESLPELEIGQMYYRGVTFAGTLPGHNYQYQKLSGIDNPPIQSGDVQRALDQGEQVGMDLYQGRDPMLQHLVAATRGQSSAAALLQLDNLRQTLGGMMTPTGTTEYPLYVRMPSGLFVAMCRPRKHNFDYDVNAYVAKGIIVSSMWHATDPRFYVAPTHTATVGIPAPTGGAGFKFPLVFPLIFGGGSAGGILEVTNSGLFETRPIITFTGPATNPKSTNQLIAGEPSLGFTKTLAAGDTIVVNTDTGSMVFTPSGSPFGESCRKQALASNTWFNLPPGLSRLLFTSSDGVAVAGTMTVEWASAMPSL